MKKASSKKVKLKTFNEIGQVPYSECGGYIIEHYEEYREKYGSEKISTFFTSLHLDSTYKNDDSYFGEDVEEHEKYSMRNQTWMYNHSRILSCITRNIKENELMPTNIEISNDTKLSRQTVYEHLKTINVNEHHESQKDRFGLVAESLLNSLAKHAMNTCNVQEYERYIRLYLKMYPNSRQQQPKKQTANYIQVNNIFVTPESLKALPEAKQIEIEKILLAENLELLQLKS